MGRIKSHGEKLTAQSETLESHGEMLKSHGEKLTAHGEQLDLIATKVVDHDEQFRSIREQMATKDDIRGLADTLDTLVSMAQKRIRNSPCCPTLQSATKTASSIWKKTSHA